MDNASTGAATIESRVPARMDRLPWSRWHWLVIAALGITLLLDGLEVTVLRACTGRWSSAGGLPSASAYASS
jgi:hypothetical protein